MIPLLRKLLLTTALLAGGFVAQAQAAPVISSLSTTSADRSGYLEINGSGFGAADGVASIGGLAAPVGTWSDNRIVAWVPETASLGNATVQVTTSGGSSSNSLSVNVAARQANGHAKWRFRQNGPYSRVRPVIGPDGTIYSVDVFAHLYALTPDGALKWVVRGAPPKGIAVGADGTIYAGDENVVKAYNPDGTEKWTFVESPRALFFIGLSVGPDGNIYGVATEGIGTFSLTPAGTLRWAKPEPYSGITPVDYAEILFGPNGTKSQLYFNANNHTRAYDLSGKLIWTVNGDSPQPAVGPEGNVHVPYGAYAPNDGHVAWIFSSPYPYNVSDAPDVGSNGIHYLVQNTIELFGLSPTGAQIWHNTLNGTFGGPIVDPQNTQLILASVQFLDQAGYIILASAANGVETWRLPLPAENGFNQRSDTRARFAPNGLTAYIMTLTATGNNDTSASFLYALDTSATTSNQTLKSTRLTVKAVGGSSVTATGTITVQDNKNAAVSGAVVSVKWDLPNGSTVTQTATTNARGQASTSTNGTAGRYTLTVTNISKTGYTFDAANSVLTKTAKSR